MPVAREATITVVTRARVSCGPCAGGRTREKAVDGPSVAGISPTIGRLDPQRHPLWPQQGERHDADSVRTPVGGPGRDDDCVDQLGAEPVSEPHEVADVVVAHVARELDLDGERSWRARRGR